MTSDLTKRWIEAAKILALNHERFVPCPACETGTLQVHDEVFPDNPALMERYLICDACGARNVMRMHLPGRKD